MKCDVKRDMNRDRVRQRLDSIARIHLKTLGLTRWVTLSHPPNHRIDRSRIHRPKYPRISSEIDSSISIDPVSRGVPCLP